MMTSRGMKRALKKRVLAALFFVLALPLTSCVRFGLAIPEEQSTENNITKDSGLVCDRCLTWIDSRNLDGPGQLLDVNLDLTGKTPDSHRDIAGQTPDMRRDTTGKTPDMRRDTTGKTPDTQGVKNYRMPITITNSGSALTNYQIKINVSYNAHMSSDFGDIRFTLSNGSTQLAYWKESYTASASAVFWVNVPNIPSGNSTIYMYYGDPLKTDASDGSSTFVFFDDFSGTSLDASKWTSGSDGSATIHVSGGYLRLQVSSNGASKFWAYISSKNQLSLPLTIETRARLSSGSNCHGFIGTGPAQTVTYDVPNYMSFVRISNSTTYYYEFNVNGTNVNTAIISSDTWSRYSMKVVSGASSCKIESSTFSNAGTFTSTTNYLQLSVRKWAWMDGIYDWDWVAVRKYAPAEPTAVIGSEQII
jgi:hypothetical protein